MLLKNKENEYNKEGTKNINPNNKGNKTVQQKDINWSKRILGKDALTQININTIIELFIPKLRLVKRPLNDELSSSCSLIRV